MGAGKQADKGGEGKHNAISLGHGTFVGPLPVDWTMRSIRPLEGRFTSGQGDSFDYRIDSHDDPEAAQGGPRLLSYLSEPEFQGVAVSAEQVLREIHVCVPKTGGRDIVWKWLETQGRRYVRELVLRHRPGRRHTSTERRLGLAETIAEWLRLGAFAEQPTPLDRVAHTASLERVNFSDTVLMRVPRGWKIEVAHQTRGRDGFAIDEPEDRETIWVTSFLTDMRRSGEAAARASMRITADARPENLRAQFGASLIRARCQDMPEGDLLVTSAKTEIDENTGEGLLRRTWERYGVRDGWLIVAPIHLVTAEQYLDRPEQIETEATVEREVRNALLLPPPPRPNAVIRGRHGAKPAPDRGA